MPHLADLSVLDLLARAGEHEAIASLLSDRTEPCLYAKVEALIKERDGLLAEVLRHARMGLKEPA